MRKLLAIALVFAAGAAYAQDLATALYKSVDALSVAYQKAHPETGMKAGLAILDIEEHAELARKHRLGKTVEAYLRGSVERSLIYELVDRKNLDQVLKEMELSLSGLVDGKTAPGIVELTGVRAFLWGDITESGDRFLVSLGVTDAGTGAVVETSSFEIDKRRLVKVAEELAYSYVAPNGIGITAQYFTPVYMLSDLYNKAPLTLFDGGLAYRFSRNLMLSGGIQGMPVFTGEHFRVDDDIAVSEVQPQLGDVPDPWGFVAAEPGGTFSQYTAQFQASFARLDAQYTINFSPKLNLGLSGGVFATLTNPKMLVTYGGENSGLFYRRQLAVDGDPTDPASYYQMPFIDAVAVEYLFEQQFVPGVKAELRPELFITPRLALSARLGFMWMQPLSVREVHASNASWWFYQEGKDATAWTPDLTFDPSNRVGSLYSGEQTASWIYYGWNPLLRPDGAYWSYDISCFYAYLGLSFFF